VDPTLDRHGPVAVAWHRFGPYHHARLRAGAALLPVVGVEITSVDRVNRWAPVEGADGFRKLTVFDGEDVGLLPAREARRRLAAALDALRPRVVAVSGWADRSALMLLAWAVARGAPAVLMSDSHALGGGERPSALRRTVKRAVVRHFSSALVAGRPQAAHAAALGIAPERISDGYDVVDNDHFERGAARARSREAEERRRLGLPERYFLAVGRLVDDGAGRPKNHRGLLAAYARYRAAAGGGDAAWKLVLVGDGERRDDLERLRARLGLEGHVLMPGYKQYDELPAYYGLASALVMPSLSETWGLVVNEAMAAGLPVIVSDRCGCAPDLVREGRNGLLFDPRDADALAAAMGRLAHGRADRAAMGEESRAIIAGWGPRRFALGLRAAVDAALAAPPPSATPAERALLWALANR
jgi:1,2-diacylglycerol 3-alpha-glucosyltransferase